MKLYNVILHVGSVNMVVAALDPLEADKIAHRFYLQELINNPDAPAEGLVEEIQDPRDLPETYLMQDLAWTASGEGIEIAKVLELDGSDSDPNETSRLDKLS